MVTGSIFCPLANDEPRSKAKADKNALRLERVIGGEILAARVTYEVG